MLTFFCQDVPDREHCVKTHKKTPPARLRGGLGVQGVSEPGRVFRFKGHHSAACALRTGSRAIAKPLSRRRKWRSLTPTNRCRSCCLRRCCHPRSGPCRQPTWSSCRWSHSATVKAPGHQSRRLILVQVLGQGLRQIQEQAWVDKPLI
jgi:hypothetical protein